jgi:hypothetical protein
MAGMSARPPGEMTRRTLLAAAAVGIGALAAGCTAHRAAGPDAVTRGQEDALVAQVRLQEGLVAAYAAATAADTALAARVAPLAAQAQTQLDRLRAAAPSAATTAPASGAAASGSPASRAASGSGAAPTTDAPPAGAAGPWLRERVAAAAASHAAAAAAQSGARAALLGAVAAGLRGQDGLLA